MGKDEFYSRLLGIAPTQPTTLSKLLGTLPPPEPPTGGTLNALSGLSGLYGAPKPQPPLRPRGIRFQDKIFSEPKAFASAWLPPSPGIYAILVYDASCKPRPYRVIYFGMARDLAARAVSSHEKYSAWCRAAGGAGKLYVSHHAITNARALARAIVEEQLIKAYSPECNRTHNPSGGFFGS
jgi:hypothetical protein